MAKRQVFYSFHYDNDVFRVQQVRNIGAIEGNASVAKNEWEQIQRTPNGVKRWIDENMNYRSCVIVLVGSDTWTRPWVKYEIEKAWNDGKGLFGIYIHNLKDPRTANASPMYGKCVQGQNPFDKVTLDNGKKLSQYVKCYNPNSTDAYNDIAVNLDKWVEDAINSRTTS